MIDRSHDLAIVRPCQALGLARSTAYSSPKPVSPAELALRRRIDALHRQHPFAGARLLRDLLGQEGRRVGRQRVAGLMAKMGIAARYRQPNTSRRKAGDQVYPYLLRELTIDRPNPVWATDITDIPMQKGFVYWVAVVDGYSRKVRSWRLSNTLTTDCCLDAVREAIWRHGTPEIFNTDQGCQFTRAAFTGLLQEYGIRISRDGKGCWRDNVFVERLWRSVKYQEVYLKAYDSVGEAKTPLGAYLAFYNTRRPHRAFDGRTPDAIYFAGLPAMKAAA
jgi:putative transposase